MSNPRDTTLTKTLRDTALKMNADVIGFADPARFLDLEYTGNKPRDIMPDVRYVIVLGGLRWGCV
ncbi:MAG: hypothetical protein SCH66_10785 [Methanolobus sp.]|nr:hypothetical protein [Methanolobus sp.]